MCSREYLKILTRNRFLHPYQTEIENYKFPPSMYIKADPTPSTPYESTTATLVDTPEALDEMLAELKKAKEIAIDLEHHDTRSYIGLVSLMQISTRNHDWIIDTLKPWRRRLERLNEVFADPSILKVGHT
jgi:exosome complex exonuclease RRP6